MKVSNMSGLVGPIANSAATSKKVMDEVDDLIRAFEREIVEQKCEEVEVWLPPEKNLSPDVAQTVFANVPGIISFDDRPGRLGFAKVGGHWCVAVQSAAAPGRDMWRRVLSLPEPLRIWASSRLQGLLDEITLYWFDKAATIAKVHQAAFAKTAPSKSLEKKE